MSSSSTPPPGAGGGGAVTTLPGSTGTSGILLLFNETSPLPLSSSSTSDTPRSTVDPALEVLNNEAKLATYIGTTLTLAFVVAAIVTLVMLAIQRIRHKKQMRRAFNNAARGHAFGAATAGLRRRSAKLQHYDSDDVHLHTTDDEEEGELEFPDLEEGDEEEDSDGPSYPGGGVSKGDDKHKKKKIATKNSSPPPGPASGPAAGSASMSSHNNRSRATSAEKRSSLMSELDTVLEGEADAAPEHVAPTKRRELKPKKQAGPHSTTAAVSNSKSPTPNGDRRRQGRRQSVTPAASVTSPAKLKSVVVVDASSPRKDTRKVTRRRHRGSDDFLLQFYKSTHGQQDGQTVGTTLQVEGAQEGAPAQNESDTQQVSRADAATVNVGAEGRNSSSSDRIVRQASKAVADVEPKKVGPRRRRGNPQDTEAVAKTEDTQGPIQLHDALTPTGDGEQARPVTSSHAPEPDAAPGTQETVDKSTTASSSQSELSIEKTPFAFLVSKRSSALMAARQWSKHHAARSEAVAPAASVSGTSSGGMPMLGTFSDFVAKRASASTAARRWGRRHRKAASLSSTPSSSLLATHNKVSPEKALLPAKSEVSHARHMRQLSADMADMVNGDALVEALALFEEGGQPDAETTTKSIQIEDGGRSGGAPSSSAKATDSRSARMRRQISVAPAGSKDELHAAIALFETDDGAAVAV